MPFLVVRRTWGPDSVPRSPHPGSDLVSTDVLETSETLRGAERSAKVKATGYPSSGYNPKHDYWWARDDDYRYTFTVEGPKRYPPVTRAG